jgi:hypothetical protein
MFLAPERTISFSSTFASYRGNTTIETAIVYKVMQVLENEGINFASPAIAPTQSESMPYLSGCASKKSVLIILTSRYRHSEGLRMLMEIMIIYQRRWPKIPWISF